MEEVSKFEFRIYGLRLEEKRRIETLVPVKTKEVLS